MSHPGLHGWHVWSISHQVVAIPLPFFPDFPRNGLTAPLPLQRALHSRPFCYGAFTAIYSSLSHLRRFRLLFRPLFFFLFYLLCSIRTHDTMQTKPPGQQDVIYAEKDKIPSLSLMKHRNGYLVTYLINARLSLEYMKRTTFIPTNVCLGAEETF